MRPSAWRDTDGNRGLVAGAVVRIDDAAGGDFRQGRGGNQRPLVGGKLPSAQPFHHDVEFDLPVVLTAPAGGPHPGDHTARFGAVPNELELVAGEQAFADEHVVEGGLDGQHVCGCDKAFVRFVPAGFGFDDGAIVCDQCGGAAGDQKAEEDEVDELVGGESEQQCSGHAISVCSCAGYRTQLYAGQMSAGFEVATAVAVSQPRRAVIDRAWRAIGPGVEVLSGDDGGPLRRTVKRILDPLVLRLRANTQYSAPFVDAGTAVAMHDVIVGHATQLRDAAAWFELLKRERRRLRITAGNAQELYFPVCFELAVTKNAPAQADAESILRGIHGDRDRTATEVLNQYAADQEVIAKLTDQLGRSWNDVRPGREITGPFLAGLTTVLGPAEGHNAAVARQRVWSALIADATPYNLGAKAHSAAGELPWSIAELGLSSVEPQHPPAIIGGSDSDRPLNRSVVDRVRATLRRAMDRDELPDIPLLCAEEVDRSCAPWGLLAEDKQAALIAGIEIGACLAPLTETALPRYELAAQIQARLRKEAYVLHARRYLTEGGPMHPRQQQVIDDLASFARPYLSRLWARLHGRDVWQEPCDDVDDVRALLEGVARSVSLDHRQRIKSMLELQVAG